MESAPDRVAEEAGSTIERVVPPLVPSQRLDRWLAASMGGERSREVLSRSRIQALVRDGALTVNGTPCRDAAVLLRGGERLVLRVPPPAPAHPEPEAIPLDILHEDDDVIVLVKPVGLVVHPGAGVPSGTLVNALLHHAKGSLSGIGGIARPGIVHRLDRDTSGVMVVAKTDRAHQGLSAQFADHGRTGPLERSYLALVWGEPLPSTGTIDAPLRRDPKDRTRRAVGEGGDARHAVTHYETTERLGQASLLHCRLETGRTHQIRVHLAHKGHPLLGDRTYGLAFRSKEGTLSPSARAALDAMPGQTLHAETLGFAHPVTGETMRFSAPPEGAMAELIAALRKEE